MWEIIFVTFWGFTSVFVLTFGVLCLFQSKGMFLDYLFKYGKTKNDARKHFIEAVLFVPKRWFLHFYICGFSINSIALYQTIKCYYSGSQDLLHHFVVEKSTTCAYSVLVVLFLFVIQNARRLYECTCVSVYNKSGQISVMHYGAGMLLYSTFPLVLWSQAPPCFTTIENFSEFISKRHIIGVAIFAWASWQQHRCHVILARMRKDKSGRVRNTDHHLPIGGWFNLVTSPHFLMEIIIYFSLLLIIGFTHAPMWTIFFFVFSNQSIAALQSHDWYRRTFMKPEERKWLARVKAIFPYVL